MVNTLVFKSKDVGSIPITRSFIIKFKKMLKVLILQGLPASGKSTYAKELMEREPNKWKRINKDLLREMLDHSEWSERNEDLIIKTRDLLMCFYLESGFNVIIDDTNFHTKHIETIKRVTKKFDIEIDIKLIDTPLYECLERDSKRSKKVGEKVILDMYKKYLRAGVETKEFLSNDKLPPAIICDIDGTLAYSPCRSVYDYTKVDKDIPNKKLIEMLKLFKSNGYKLIIFSGRNDDSKNETEAWLKKHEIEYDLIDMRVTGDLREDSIVKKEMYLKNVENKYNILTVFDDRPRVIRMWKSLGLMVCDVNRQDSRIDF